MKDKKTKAARLQANGVAKRIGEALFWATRK